MFARRVFAWMGTFVEADDADQLVWHRKPLSVLALFVFIGFLVYWEIFVPPPGEAVAALGVAAAAMSIRGEMRGKEKVAWLCVLFAFLSLELTSIRMERKANEEMQSQVRWQEATHFKQVLDTSRDQFKSTIDDNRKHFDTTMKLNSATLSGVQESIKTMTGGDSFAVLVLLQTGGKEQFSVLLSPMGKYPLHALNIRTFACASVPETIEDIKDGNSRGEQTRTIGELPAPMTYQDLSFPEGTNAVNCHAMLFASNGYWNQITQLRFANGAWKKADKIVRGSAGHPDGKVLLERIEDGYPKESDGSVKWFMSLKP